MMNGSRPTIPAGVDLRPVARSSAGRTRSQASRRSVIEAARAEFFERGLFSTSIEGIAARARVGKATVYRWWPSKPDILLEVFLTEASSCGRSDSLDDPKSAFPACVGGYITLGGRDTEARLFSALLASSLLEPSFGVRFDAAVVREIHARVTRIMVRSRFSQDESAEKQTNIILSLIVGAVWHSTVMTGSDGLAATFDEIQAFWF